MNKDDLAKLCGKEAEIVLISEKVSSISDRLAEYSQLSKDVQTLVIELRLVKESQNDFKGDIRSLKAKPGDTLKWLGFLVGGAVIMAAVNLVLKAIGL